VQVALVEVASEVFASVVPLEAGVEVGETAGRGGGLRRS
jgi:hypothetical protein